MSAKMSVSHSRALSTQHRTHRRGVATTNADRNLHAENLQPPVDEKARILDLIVIREAADFISLEQIAQSEEVCI